MPYQYEVLNPEMRAVAGRADLSMRLVDQSGVHRDAKAAAQRSYEDTAMTAISSPGLIGRFTRSATQRGTSVRATRLGSSP